VRIMATGGVTTHPAGARTAIADYSHLGRTALAVALSGAGKCVLALTAVWAYPPAFLLVVDGFVLSSRVVALSALLRCSRIIAAVIMVPAMVTSLLARAWALDVLHSIPYIAAAASGRGSRDTACCLSEMGACAA
jgi:hypothetical protein